MLAEDFDTILHNLGMAWLEHPLFHPLPLVMCGMEPNEPGLT